MLLAEPPVQTPTSALEDAHQRVLRGFNQNLPADSVAAFLDVGPDVDRRLWTWWMTLHSPDERPKNAQLYKRYYDAVYEALEDLWSRQRR